MEPLLRLLKATIATTATTTSAKITRTIKANIGKKGAIARYKPAAINSPKKIIANIPTSASIAIKA